MCFYDMFHKIKKKENNFVCEFFLWPENFFVCEKNSKGHHMHNADYNDLVLPKSIICTIKKLIYKIKY